MPEKKGKKSKKNGKNGAKSSTKGKSKGSKKTSRGSKRSAGKTRFTMDVFSDDAMNNAYYTCHNVMDLLYNRGFPWPDLQKKKKKGKK